MALLEVRSTLTSWRQMKQTILKYVKYKYLLNMIFLLTFMNNIQTIANSQCLHRFTLPETVEKALLKT